MCGDDIPQLQHGGVYMYYVYSVHMKTGKEILMGVFDTSVYAIQFIHKRYSVDSGVGELGKYYYYMREC